MDKKVKQHRHKNLTKEELSEIAPRGASFDTEEGRAAQGMRPDIGSGSSTEERKRDEPPPAKPPPDADDGAGKNDGTT
jgi:hypothetical protein